MPGHRRLVAESFHQPAPGGVGVGHRLLGREGLRGDDEKGPGGVEAAGLLDEVGGIDVGDEADLRTVAVRTKGLADHRRAEIGTADSDVDHIGNGLAGEPGPLASSHGLRKPPHLLENVVDLRHHVEAIDHDRCVAPVAQRHVEHGTVLGPVDPLTGEHRRSSFPHTTRPRQIAQQADGLVGNAVFRIVEYQIVEFHRESVGPAGIAGKEIAHVNTGDLTVVVAKRLPRRSFRQWRAGANFAIDFRIENHLILQGPEREYPVELRVIHRTRQPGRLPHRTVHERTSGCRGTRPRVPAVEVGAKIPKFEIRNPKYVGLYELAHSNATAGSSLFSSRRSSPGVRPRSVK